MSEQDSLFKQPGDETTSAGTPTPFSRPAGTESDLAEQLRMAQRQLSNLMVVLLVFLLVVSGTLAIFLWQQVRYAKADLVTLQVQSQQLDQAKQIIAEYNSKSVPAMQKFINDLGQYAGSHPDVLPIMAKYGLVQRKPATTGTGPAPNP
jgi:hypothetical protein